MLAWIPSASLLTHHFSAKSARIPLVTKEKREDTIRKFPNFQISLLCNSHSPREKQMASPLLLFSLIFFAYLPSSQCQLSLDYYNKTCPQFSLIVEQTVTQKQITSPTTAAGTLRLFFHDCMVDGCDASILIASSSFNEAERDADINLSLPGDAFDVITRAKTAVELQCPGIVSCADILAVATRDLVVMVGGPYYRVPLGRKDGLVSKASNVEPNLPRPTTPLPKIISLFASKGLSVQEMVALLGAHTIGFSHCKEFSNRIFNYSKTSETDTAFYPKYAEGLKKLCENYTKDTSMSAYNDVMTPGKFDNMYYRNLVRGLALLSSDQALVEDKVSKPFVDLYAANETAFFEAFGRAMEKVSVYNVKTGKEGEIRHRCDHFNAADQN